VKTVDYSQPEQLHNNPQSTGEWRHQQPTCKNHQDQAQNLKELAQDPKGNPELQE
jgi:hypothetical protein